MRIIHFYRTIIPVVWTEIPPLLYTILWIFVTPIDIYKKIIIITNALSHFFHSLNTTITTTSSHLAYRPCYYYYYLYRRLYKLNHYLY